MKSTLPAVLSLVVTAALTQGCSPERREVRIDEMRVVKERPPRLGATSAERFGTMRAPSSSDQPSTPAFDYDLPAGWRELPLQQFRDLNLGAPGGVQAWVTVMGPAMPGAHDEMSNLTRWHGQLGLAPPTDQTLGALQRRPLLGRDALLVDLTDSAGQQRLVGLMQFTPQRSVFVRMSGTPDAVDAQLAAFDAFATSLREGAPRSTSGGNAARGGDAGGAGVYAWTRPATWTDVGPGPGKLFEFEVGEARCWLSELSGDGGGLDANLVRWAGQVGQPVPAAATLPKLEVLGRPSPYVELLGGGATVGLIGVIVPVGDDTLFVKLRGPSSLLRARQAEFEAFCASLTTKE